jgi:copper transport protein
MKRTVRPISILARGATLLLVLLGVSAAPASAHNSLTGTEPTDGSTLDIAPTSWTLTFTGAVPLDSASAEVVRADGTRVALSPPTQGPTTNVIVFALPEGLSGAVTARWRLVGTDGHVITGRTEFSVVAAVDSDPAADTGDPEVGADPSASSTTAPLEPVAGDPATDDIDSGDPGSSSGTLGSADTVPAFTEPIAESIRWVLQIASYLGLMIVGGLLFAEIALARGIMRRPRAMIAMQGGALTLFVVSAISTLIHVSDVEGVSLGSAFRYLGNVFDTSAGSMLVMRTVIGFTLMMVALALDQRPSEARMVKRFAALVVLFIVTMPFTGHSRSMRWPALGVPADIVHILGVTVWIGGLMALVVFVMPSARSGHAVIAYVRFSAIASWAVGAIVVTGVIQTARLHGVSASLINSSHGLLLAIKVMLVLVMIGVGWWSRRLLTNDDGESDLALRARLIRVTAYETALGIAVVGVSAALVRATFAG